MRVGAAGRRAFAPGVVVMVCAWGWARGAFAQGEIDPLLGSRAVAIADADGDGVEDVAVSVPRDGVLTDRVGRVHVYSGATGERIGTLAGARGERFGVFISGEEDVDGDGTADLRVDSLALSAEGVPYRRVRVYTAGVGGVPELLEDHPDLRPVVVRADRGGFGGGRGLVRAGAAEDPAREYTSEELAALREFLALWGGVYPDDPVAWAVGFDRAVTGAGVVSWFAGAGVGVEERTGPMVSGADRCLAVCLGDGADPPAPLTADPCDYGCGCEAGVRITSCPQGPLRYGDLVTVRAEWSATCQDRFWEITSPEGGVRVVEGGDTLSMTAEELGGFVTGGWFQIAAVCRCFEVEARDVCTVEVGTCALEIVECPGTMGRGDREQIVAQGVPPGGSYTWRILGPCNGAGYPDGNRFVLEPRYDDRCGTITVEVTYTYGDCVRTASCAVGLFDNDSDGDGVPDYDEILNGTDPNDPDSDDDGVSDGDEGGDGTNANDSDTDDDGVSDGCEKELGWDPRVPDDARADTDHDGLKDVDEVCGEHAYHTDPFSVDTDGDGIYDGCEVDHTWDPTDARDPAGLSGDSDGDGLCDAQETTCGSCTSEWEPDTDFDGIDDRFETNSMGLLFPCDPDSDNDGLLDGVEFNAMTSIAWIGDSDRDGMLDGFEVMNGLNPADRADAAGDPDGDGLVNRLEHLWGTDPRGRDSDGDGVWDGQEVNAGSDPTSGRSAGPGTTARVHLRIRNPGGGSMFSLRVGARTLAMAEAGVAAEAVVELERGASYPVEVRFNGSTNWKCPREIDYSYCAEVTVLDGVPHAVDDEPKVHCQLAAGVLGCHDGTDEKCHLGAGKTAWLDLFISDIDIDSDNSGEDAFPDRSEAEEQAEEDVSDGAPGKVILAGTFDSDYDGVPDFADGFDTMGGGVEIDDGSPGTRFVPVVLEIRGVRDLDSAVVRLSYPASDPGAVAPSPTDPFVLPPGRLRLWKKPGDEPRLAAKVRSGGHFIAPGDYAPSQLGFSAGGPTVTVWAEVVRESAAVGDIAISVDLDPTGHAGLGVFPPDIVRITGTRMQITDRAPGQATARVLDGFIVTEVFPAEDGPYSMDDPPGALRWHSVRVYDPRDLAGHAVRVGNNAFPLTRAGDRWETGEFVVIDNARTPGSALPPAPTAFFDGPRPVVEYNPRAAPPSIGQKKAELGRRLVEREVNKAIAAMKKDRAWIKDYSLKDDGMFGKEVHRRVTDALEHKTNWLANVVVEESTNVILEIGGSTGGASRVQIDLLHLEDDYRPAVGEVLDPSRIHNVHELKLSLDGKLTSTQKGRLTQVAGGQPPIVTTGSERWVAGKGWQQIDRVSTAIRLVKRVGAIVGVVGLIEAGYAICHSSEFDDDLYALGDAIRIAQRETDPTQRRQDAVEALFAARTYLNHFSPSDTVVDAITLAAVLKVIAEPE